MSILYYPNKVNIIVGAPSRLSMESITHVGEGNKKLTRDVHRLTRLGVCNLEFEEGGVLV